MGNINEKIYQPEPLEGHHHCSLRAEKLFCECVCAVASVLKRNITQVLIILDLTKIATTTMKYFILILAPFASAFVITPATRPTLSLQNVADGFSADVDMSRAKECAEKFGKCSLKEVKDLRDSVHDARVKTMFLSNVGGGVSHNEDTLFEQRLLEEDLSLQLKLLDEATPEKSLFPKDATMHEEATMHPDHFQPATASTRALTLLDENMLESIAICAVFGILVMAPHLLNV
mmetsp:Transcript_3827/g.6384  ORF Transcript_3827/g.6384 Transcript_3827/m.6384 type:complete len:232 (-) Transcript_3827:62-757(-)